MGRSQREKGRRGENELVKYLTARAFDAERISAMYKPGADVKAFGGRLVEVKRRAQPVSKQLDDWLEDVDLVAVRVDRGVWHCWLELDVLLDLIDGAN